MRPDFKIQANFLGDGRRAGGGRGGGLEGRKPLLICVCLFIFDFKGAVTVKGAGVGNF